jgi:hypothetical protein
MYSPTEECTRVQKPSRVAKGHKSKHAGDTHTLGEQACMRRPTATIPLFPHSRIPTMLRQLWCAVHSARSSLACLNSLSQLDRLTPGSTGETKSKGLVPRRRGDVHPDLTAAVLSCTVHPTSSYSSPRSGVSTTFTDCTSQDISDHSMPWALYTPIRSHTHGTEAMVNQNAPEEVSCGLVTGSTGGSMVRSEATSTCHDIAAPSHSNVELPAPSCGSGDARSQKSAPQQSRTLSERCHNVQSRAPLQAPPPAAHSDACGQCAQHATLKHAMLEFDSMRSMQAHSEVVSPEERSPNREVIAPVSTSAGPIAVAINKLQMTAPAVMREICKGGIGGNENELLVALDVEEARRRWGLLRMHVRIQVQERNLRTHMWRVALNEAMNPLAPADSGQTMLFSSFQLGEGFHACAGCGPAALEWAGISAQHMCKGEGANVWVGAV